MAQLVVLLVLVAGIVAAVVLIRRPRRRSGPDPRLTMQSFFGRTGYAFADARGAPLPAAIDRWHHVYLAHMRENAPYEVQWVRSYQGLDVFFRDASSSTTNGNMRTHVWAQSWWTAPMPLAVPFHIVHRALVERTGKIRLPDTWQPSFPNRIHTGDPQLDQHFAIFTPAPPDRVRAILQNPRLRAALFACSYVDLRVTPERTQFSDPLHANADVSGKGASAESYQACLPIHERVADILLGATSLAR